MAYIQKNNPFKEDGESPFQLAQWRKNRRRKMRLFGEGWFDPIKDFFKKKSKAKKTPTTIAQKRKDAWVMHKPNRKENT